MSIWMDMLGSNRPENPALLQSIDMLEVGARAWNALRYAGCKTVLDVTRLTERQLMQEPNFGKVSLREVRHALGQIGLKLAKE